ncbi:transmembrane protease serine 11C-like [Diabrotica virgifera virgifera]|uniref:Transmembrane protease serine 11C-like isoform X1 n=1 Tax=Diabrotica virgifera virgifera TaxID=50390 RepID=A0A6P7GS78_DIAVI|nr:transmembrane protease serine 11C-like [Diabrotica virgifera virgifera]
MKTIYFIVISKIILAPTNSQAQYDSGFSNGRYFLCLPPTVPCPNIDPRIVSPTGTVVVSVCKTGFLPCYGMDPKCGTRYVTPATTTASGPTVFGEYPWQAYLSNGTTTLSFAGSGVLVSAYYVITAAHKVNFYPSVNPPTLKVYMGVWNPSNLTNVQSSAVSNIKLHESFSSSLLRNDIAVLRLTQPIVFGIFTNVNTICLPAKGTSFTMANGCSVSGWGQINFETTTGVPTVPQKKAYVNIVSYATCRASFLNVLGPSTDSYLDQNGEICAGGVNMIDACTQDGGSPLVCPTSSGALSLAGLVIWGKNCGRPGVYGVYVNTVYYADWITNNTKT